MLKKAEAYPPGRASVLRNTNQNNPKITLKYNEKKSIFYEFLMSIFSN